MRLVERRKARTTTVIAAVVALVVAGVAIPAQAATLPGGTDLSISLTAPADGAVYAVAPGDSVAVSVAGTASVGAVEPEPLTLVLVADISGSTRDPSGSTVCGNANEHGPADQIIDCEVAAGQALFAAAADSGRPVDAGIAAFGSAGAALDVSPVVAYQRLTTPDADDDGDTIPDVDEVLAGLRPTGQALQFSARSLGTGTNLGEAIRGGMEAILEAPADQQALVVFVSDGEPTQGTQAEFDSRLSNLVATGAATRSFAIGPAASCTAPSAAPGSLQEIADATGGTCQHLADPGALTGILPELVTSELSEIRVDGVTLASGETSVALPATGPATTDFTTSVVLTGAGDHEICAEADGSDGGGSGTATDCVTVTITEWAEGFADVKPGSCPNPINAKARGFTPVALLGSDGIAAADVDQESLRVQGVAPDRTRVSDVATPFEGDLETESSCHEETKDGVDDIMMHVDTQALVDAFGPVSNGQTIVVEVTGSLADGTQVRGFDVVVIRGA